MKLLKRSKLAMCVKSMAKSIRFYTKTLGFTVSKHFDDWTELKGSGITLGLYPGRRGRITEDPSIGFEVANLDSAVNELRKKGVGFEFFDEDHMKFAYFTDPDGTELYLAQKKKGTRTDEA